MDDLPELPDQEVPEGSDESTVMGAYDHVEGRTRFIISDISKDEAWISVPLDREIPLIDWR